VKLVSVACRLVALAVLLGTYVARLPQVAAADSADGVDTQGRQAWVIQASADLDPRAVAALQQITGAERRLLALRAYLRAGTSLAERWTWSQEQLSAYASTAEGKAAAVDLNAVITVFDSANPGFTLRVNRMPRSLAVQLAHWNENRSVGIAATALATALDRQFAGAVAPGARALRDAMMNWTPVIAATLAAPGLSAHGQARAFDFQIEHDGKVIAGIDAASAHRQWDQPGWTGKLHAAVGAAGNRFTGPLSTPYEPWHYAYMSQRSAP
jgi:hypothetical protein